LAGWPAAADPRRRARTRLRSGTLPAHQIAGMGEAAGLIAKRRNQYTAHTRNLERRFLDRLQDIEQVAVNGDRAHRVAGIVNLRFAGVESESPVVALPDVAIATGSACMSARVEPSYVLRALGLDVSCFGMGGILQP